MNSGRIGRGSRPAACPTTVTWSCFSASAVKTVRAVVCCPPPCSPMSPDWGATSCSTSIPPRRRSQSPDDHQFQSRSRLGPRLHGRHGLQQARRAVPTYRPEVIDGCLTATGLTLRPADNASNRRGRPGVMPCRPRFWRAAAASSGRPKPPACCPANSPTSPDQLQLPRSEPHRRVQNPGPRLQGFEQLRTTVDGARIRLGEACGFLQFGSIHGGVSAGTGGMVDELDCVRITGSSSGRSLICRLDR